MVCRLCHMTVCRLCHMMVCRLCHMTVCRLCHMTMCRLCHMKRCRVASGTVIVKLCFLSKQDRLHSANETSYQAADWTLCDWTCWSDMCVCVWSRSCATSLMSSNVGWRRARSGSTPVSAWPSTCWRTEALTPSRCRNAKNNSGQWSAGKGVGVQHPCTLQTYTADLKVQNDIRLWWSRTMFTPGLGYRNS